MTTLSNESVEPSAGAAPLPDDVACGSCGLTMSQSRMLASQLPDDVAAMVERLRTGGETYEELLDLCTRQAADMLERLARELGEWKQASAIANNRLKVVNDAWIAGVEELNNKLAAVKAERDMWKETDLRDAKRIDELAAELSAVKTERNSLKRHRDVLAVEKLNAVLAYEQKRDKLAAVKAALPDDYTESKDWAFDKSPVQRIEWLKARHKSMKEENTSLVEQLADANEELNDFAQCIAENKCLERELAAAKAVLLGVLRDEA